MPDRRGAGRRVAGILGCVAIVAVAVVGIRYGLSGARPDAGHSAASAIGESSTLADLAAAVKISDPKAVAEIHRRLTPPKDGLRKPYSDEEAVGWLGVLSGLRTGFLGYKAAGRIASVGAAALILDGFAIEPAHTRWAESLPPMHDLLTASLGDSDPNLRAAGLDAIARLWVWLPSRPLTEAEETALVKWKEGLYQPVIRCLGYNDARTLVAAVACLGALPIDSAAAPALAYLEKDIPEVRKQILVSFAKRNLLLTDDVLLSRLHDPDALIRAAAHAILKGDRKLSNEQITLGSLIFSPDPQQRMAVIPMLKDRSDVDPAIWLIQLSRDPEEVVRLSAIEAMSPLKSNSVKRRLTEMARTDASEAVRKAAGKLVAQTRPTTEDTASLPPLPGSPALNPRAN